MGKLTALLNPKSVVIVGASRDEHKIGGIIVRQVFESGYKGKVFLVNPNAEEIQGRTVLARIADIDEMVELAIVCVPVGVVAGVMRELGEKGVHQAVVFSAGYGELGEEGKKLEAELIDLCKQYEIEMLGPNCLGFVNTMVPLNASFAAAPMIPGNLRFISQSGAIASAMFDWFEATKLGFGEFVSLGNKAMVGENEFLEYWLDQPRPDMSQLGEGLSRYMSVGMYLESVVAGREFYELVRKTARRDPVFVLKPGKSKGAQKAMQSHTGALAGEDYVFETMLRQAGGIRCEGIEDLFDLAKLFSWENPPEMRSIAVLSNAGGPAVISADAVEEYGLKLALIPDATREKLKEVLPRAASVANPVDVLGDALADRYKSACELLLQEEQVGGLVVILTPQVMTQIEETAQAIGALSMQYGKTVVGAFMGGAHVSKGERVLSKYRIPSFRYPERAIKGMAAMRRWYEFSQVARDLVVMSMESNENVTAMVKGLADKQVKALSSRQAYELLKLGGIEQPAMKVVSNEADAFGFAEEVGMPVVMKLSSETLLHKTEVGGVRVGLGSGEEVYRALGEFRQKAEKLGREGDRVEVVMQKQVEAGVEVLCGIKRDPTYGPVLMVGAGGVLAELVADRNLGLLPLSEDELVALVERAKVYSLLKGYRNQKRYAIDELVSLLQKLVAVVWQAEEIEEIEINPVIVTEKKAWVVDPKVVLRGSAADDGDK